MSGSCIVLSLHPCLIEMVKIQRQHLECPYLNEIYSQVSTLSIWSTCPSGTRFWICTCPANIFTCPGGIATSPVNLMYTAWRISMCPGRKITCPVGHITTKVYVQWDKIYMPRACGHALMSSPDNDTALVQIRAWHRTSDKPLPEPVFIKI